MITFSPTFPPERLGIYKDYLAVTIINNCMLTQIWSLTRLSCLKTVFTLKSMPTVLTNADVKLSSAYLENNDVFYINL